MPRSTRSSARAYAHSSLTGPASLLIMPNADAAHIALNLLRCSAGHLGRADPDGRRAACAYHSQSATVRGLLNLTAIAVVEAQGAASAGERLAAQWGRSVLRRHRAAGRLKDRAMSQSLIERCPASSTRSRAEGALQVRAGDRLAAGRRDRRRAGRACAEFLRQQLSWGSRTIPPLIAAGQARLARYGWHGLGAVHLRLYPGGAQGAGGARLSQFLGTEDAILYSSRFDANAGLFETLLGEEDAIISDALNHASVIDGVRLCKARRWRYANNDMADLGALYCTEAAGRGIG